MKTYKTTRDLVIPAGTEVGSPPIDSTRWGVDYEAVVAVDADHTAYFTLDVADALEAGFVEVSG